MPSIEGIKLKSKRFYFRLTSKHRRNRLKNESFSIISNNCWGGFVYQSYGIKYSSPTIGLYFMADDYIKFLSNIHFYLSLDLKFIEPTKSKYYQEKKSEKRFGNYPIGLLGDVEIFFLHYNSSKEAQSKWNRRVALINFEKLLVKFNDQNGCRREHFEKFEKLDFKNKICFVSNQNVEFQSCVWIKNYNSQQCIMASQEPIGNSKYININELINKL